MTDKDAEFEAEKLKLVMSESNKLLAETVKELAEARAKLRRAVKGLKMISQFESLPIDDSLAIVKKHNTMAAFARDALFDMDMEDEELEGE